MTLDITSLQILLVCTVIIAVFLAVALYFARRTILALDEFNLSLAKTSLQLATNLIDTQLDLAVYRQMYPDANLPGLTQTDDDFNKAVEQVLAIVRNGDRQGALKNSDG